MVKPPMFGVNFLSSLPPALAASLASRSQLSKKKKKKKSYLLCMVRVWRVFISEPLGYKHGLEEHF